MRADGSPVPQRKNLRDESEGFLVHLENSPLALIEWDAECRITRWSKRAEKIFGWRAEEVEGVSFFDFRFVHDDDLELIRTVVKSLKEGSQIFGTTKNRNYTKSGATVHCSWHNSSVPRKEGTQWTVTSLVLDETASEVNNELLKRQNERLARTLAATEMGIWDIDIASGSVFWLGCMEKLMGFGPGEFSGTVDAALRFVAPETTSQLSPKEICLAVKATGGIFERTLRISDSTSGTAVDRWVQVKGHAVYDEAGDPLRLSGTAVDVTDARSSEDELRAAKHSADSANASKSAFLANMSHEIRTPLGVILGFSELLADPELPSEERIEFAGTISRNGRHLSRLIDDILDLSKVEAGRLEIFRTEIDLETALTDIFEIHSDRAAAKNVNLHLDISAEVPTQILTDIVRFKQIVSNLLNNSLKFTHDGEVKLAVSACEVDEKTLLKVAVTDSGIGISADGQQKLFEPFVQADRVRTRQFGGTGLGLALSRKLARALGGDLVLSNSAPDLGSTFEFTHLIDSAHFKHDIAQRKAVALDAGAGVETGSNAKGNLEDLSCHRPLAGIKILLAEDTPDNQILMDRMIRKRGGEITIASDGEEAIERALSGDFDIVLMDIQMPKLDGYEATRRLRHAGYKKPIVALTAHAMKGESLKCLAAGCNEHLSKPVRPEELVQTIRQQLLGPDFGSSAESFVASGRASDRGADSSPEKKMFTNCSEDESCLSRPTMSDAEG